MKYKKAQDILPKDVLDLVQKYIDGDYIYIPKKDNNKKSWGEVSGIKAELKTRNFEIYIKYLQGTSIKQLSKDYFLSESSIRRILYSYKNI
ncbi:CD3324 family protein [Clostridium sp. ZBS13]|uniref:CD3324 family protein n=1 Tax=Clostridium sp. ZBS13 TaxID=2949971 RepID=UPI002079EFCD|nr:CD3324 family protein [Clostridium sp. ZBS13]